VTATISASAISASTYGVSDGHVARPSAANGYREAIEAGITMWSLTHSESKPAASAPRASSGIPTSRGRGPAFGTRAPIRTVTRQPRIARSSSSAPGDRTLRCRTLHVLPGKQIEIRWRDLDAYGHVNQAVYLTFAEEILDDWFRRAFGLRPGTV